MPAGRKESCGSRPAVVCNSSKVPDKDIVSPYSARVHNGKMSSSSDHLIPIAPRMTAMHDTRFTYRPVMRQVSPGQQPMYPYHGMGSHGMAMHAPGPYQAYYPRSMMLSSPSSSSDAMVPGMSYAPSPGETHPHVPVGAAAYSYAMSPWQAPSHSSRKRKATRSSVTNTEKDLSPELEHTEEMDSSKQEKRKERARNLAAGKHLSTLEQSTNGKDADPASGPPSSSSVMSISDKLSSAATTPVAMTTTTISAATVAPKGENDDDSLRYQSASASPSMVSDDENDKVFRGGKRTIHPMAGTPHQAPGSTRGGSSACVTGGDATSAGSQDGGRRQTPDTIDDYGSTGTSTTMVPTPDNARRFPPGACKKVYSPTAASQPGSSISISGDDTAIEPLSALYAPAGLDAGDQVLHYRKTLASLHERLKKEHELCRQVSSQRIRAEMMWEAVAQELRQLRVHLARLATQPLPTAMAGSMQMP